MLFKLEWVVMIMIGNMGCDMCILFNKVMLFICGICMLDMIIFGV